MSRVGATTGSPLEGSRRFWVESITWRASATEARESGTWTAIWSPSKSALKAVHTSGWIWMALPSMSTGSNAWMPRRCSVGARLSSTGRSLAMSSRMSQTSGRARSTMRLADLMLWARLRATRACITNGLNSSSAIFFGMPHWLSLSSGPPTITEQPEEATRLPRRVWRQQGQDAHDHPGRLAAALAERLHHAQALGGLLAALPAEALDLVPELDSQRRQVQAVQDVHDRLGAHAGRQQIRVAVR